MADQLATPEDLASLLERDDVDEYKATMLIECATAVVQAAAGQRIVEVVDDEVVLDLDEHDRSPYLWLPERPVTAVDTVLIGGSAVTDYSTQLRRARLWRADGWRSTLVSYHDQPSTVTVTYSHGYPAGHQRLQLARAAVLGLVRGVYGNPEGASRVQIDDYAAAYDAIATRLEASPYLRDALKRQYGRLVGSAVLTTTSTGGPTWR
jgi:hypothetical protein